MRPTCRRLLFRVDSPLRHDSGVIAVVTAIVVAFVLVPVAALGLTTYTRTSVAGEMQRAADSGALAGAASLALLNLGGPLNGRPLEQLPTATLQGLVATPPNVLDVIGPGGRACDAARSAFASGSRVSDAFATAPGCQAVYAPDPAFAACTDALLTRVLVLNRPLTQRLDQVLSNTLSMTVDLGLVSVSLGSLAPEVRGTQDLVSTVHLLLPALARNGVRVTLDYDVEGPLDGVFPGAAPTGSATTATARRLFKPLLPGPSAITGSLPSGPLDGVVDLVDTHLAGTLLEAEQALVQVLQLVIRTVRVLLDGTLTKSDLVPFLNRTLGELDALLTQVLTPLLNGLLGLVGSLLGPTLGSLLAPLRTVLTAADVPDVTPLSGECAVMLDDLLVDLSYGLTLNPDDEAGSLVPCTLNYVLRPKVLSAPVSGGQACVNRVFRAQLAPNP